MAGTPYNGLAANVSIPAGVNISSSTNASPIVVQTSASHGMKTGDSVHVERHQTNTAANGIWPVVVVDSTHFSLTGSTGNGVGGATGMIRPMAFTGNVSLNPANGDPYDASAYIPGFSCLADRTAFLATTVGAYKIAQTFTFAQGSNFNATSTIVGGLAATTWTDWPTVSPFVSLSGQLVDVVTNDIVILDVRGSFSFVTASTDSPTTLYQMGLWAANFAPGVAPAYSIVQNQGPLFQNMVPSAGSWNQTVPFAMSGQVNIGTSGFIDFKAMVQANAATTRTITLQGNLIAQATVLRPLWLQ